MGSPRRFHRHLPFCGNDVMTADRDALIEDNMGLAYFIACPFFTRFPSIPHDDIVSAALFGLTQAAMRYNPASAHKFATFARATIRGTILSEIRRLTHGGRSLKTFTEIDLDGAESLIDPAEAASRLDTQLDARRQTASLTARLSRRSKLIIHMRFVEEKTIREISNRFRICEGTVSRIICEALDTMRKPVAECHVTVRRRVMRAAYDARRRAAEKKAA